MITLERPAYYVNERFAEYCGLSTDNKADIKEPHNGDYFYELDTSKIYRYNESGKEWIEQPKDTAGVNTNIPAITNETAGHFLTNDGNVTHWQSIASSDFIIMLTDNKDGTYSADKTFVEIKTAFESKENIAVSVGNGNTRLPLMNAEIADNGDAGFTFGYTQLTLDAQLVSTRAINYFHTVDVDQWTDNDQAGEYLKIIGGTMTGNISMGANSITDVQEIQVNPANPVYIGSVVHKQGTTGVKITATTNHELAVVSPDSQSTYKPINVGNPTAPNHAVTLGYMTQEQKDATATKTHIDVASSATETVTLANGIYLISACDTNHKGLVVVFVCGADSTVSVLSELTGWTVVKGTEANTIDISDTATSALTAYIVSIGNGGF